MLASLVLVHGPTDLPSEISVAAASVTVGRSAKDSDITVESKQTPRILSRRHATISRIETDLGLEWKIKDEGSMNGTFVNGFRVLTEKIKDGDIITFGGGSNVQIGECYQENHSGFQYQFKDLSGKPEKLSNTTPRQSNAEILSFSLDQSYPPPSEKSKNSGTFSHPCALSKNDNEQEKVSLQSRSSITRDVQTETEDVVHPEPDSNRASHEQQRMLCEDLFVWMESNRDLRAQLKIVQDNMSKSIGDSERIYQRKEALEASMKGILEGLSCAICSDVMFQSIMLECSHYFCSECYSKWSASKKECPICRLHISKEPIRSLLIDQTIQLAVENVETLEATMYKDRVKKRMQFLRKEESDIARLESALKRAKKTGHQFLRIAEQWREDEKQTFSMGVMDLQGRARLLYCECVGLTNDFIQAANITQLRICVQNLCLQVYSWNNPHALKKALQDFIRDLPGRICPVYRPPDPS
eukprot:TRINITY_DN9394_c0_g1_i2.p1 TRINITY_DN9394_c0_g1~~TRINITY_DN9394_c0_g1_i2.p1  ORF type:complete len:471 (+),score=92.08 TRINITY_DN9394_c0_g1_i2:110-1522(+)